MDSAVGENVGVHEGPRSHAMGVDATPFVEPLLMSRALSFLSYHPEIPYSKGASLRHMLEAFWDSAGQDAFRVSPVRTPALICGPSRALWESILGPSMVYVKRPFGCAWTTPADFLSGSPKGPSRVLIRSF